MEIKFRNGVPTQKSISDLASVFFERNDWKVSTGAGYGKKDKRWNFILWSDNYIQENILGFVDYLANYGIEVEDYRPYESPRVGSFNIKPKSK